MKTKELIELLQANDPSGEEECTVGNHPILSVDVEGSYYDGCQQVLIRDPEKAPYYDVVGAKYRSRGYKVTITTHSIQDAIKGNPEIPVDYSELTESVATMYRESDDKQRSKVIENCMNRLVRYFMIFVQNRLVDLYGSCPSSLSLQAAEAFAVRNFSYCKKVPAQMYDHPVDAQGRQLGVSWLDRMNDAWKHELGISMVDGVITIKKKTMNNT